MDLILDGLVLPLDVAINELRSKGIDIKVGSSAHYNTSLPPLDVKLEVLYDNEWVRCARIDWACNSKDPVEFFSMDVGNFSVLPNQIKWKYA